MVNEILAGEDQKLFRYEELPEIVRQRIANDIIEAQIESQFECLIESLGEIFNKFDWVKDFKVPYSISYSQSDYVGVELAFRRVAIKSNATKKMLKDYPDLKDVVCAYQNLLKNLKIGERFTVKFTQHYRYCFDINFYDIEGNLYDFSRNHRLETDNASSKGSAIICFVSAVREYIKKELYSLIEHIYSDEFIREEVANYLYDFLGDEAIKCTK